MEALMAVAVVLVPAVIYLARTPIRPDHVDILIAILGVWFGLTIVGYLAKWLFSEKAAFWILGAVWLAMVTYAWMLSKKERRERPARYTSKGKTNA